VTWSKSFASFVATRPRARWQWALPQTWGEGERRVDGGRKIQKEGGLWVTAWEKIAATEGKLLGWVFFRNKCGRLENQELELM